MKVTHVEDHVTHAVISGAQAIDFGISDSPEFFNILSSTLYTDQKLAVIRETLCNAWDAHIEFGCTDTAVALTLDDKYLTIRDFGPGIAPKMIGPVYGTYGGSTKASNGQVTGGFGLGCKAPFAYVDDFEVTSYHDGKMTVYRLSKSNAEVGGKPSIVPVVSNIPTQEHGLQVKIGIKNTADVARFRELIRRIVQNGAMKMTLNDNELDTLPFDDMVHGFMLTRKQVQENFCPITVRYGNVIYPIQKEETYSAFWDEIIKFLNRLTGTNHYNTNSTWSLVLQAAPNTVSVTPSRESLSNQKHTLETIRTLMQEFLAVKDKNLTVECFNLLEERIACTWLESNPAVLFSTEELIPNLSQFQQDRYGRKTATTAGKQIQERDHLLSFPEFVQQYAHTGYPDFAGFRRRDMMGRINALIQAGFGGVRGRKLLKTYRRALEQSDHLPATYKASRERYGTGQLVQHPWFHREVVAPLIKGMTKESTLRPDKLFVYPALGNYHSGREKLFPVAKWQPKDLEKMWPFARNIVILSFNKMDVIDGDADRSALSKFWLGKTENSLVYICPRAEQKVDAAREYFTKMGCFLIDLTVNQHREYVAKQQTFLDTPTLKRPKKNGIPVLSKMVNEEGNYYNLANDSNDDIERTQAPEFILKDGRRNPYTEIEHLSKADSKLLLDMFGSKGGFCTNQNQYDRYKLAGALDWKEYILNKLVEEYQTNPRILEYLPFDYHRVDTSRYSSSYYECDKWLRTISHDADLYEYFGLVDNRTDHDKRLMKVMRLFQRQYWRGSDDQQKAYEQVLKLNPVSKILTGLFDQIKASRLLKTIDHDGIDAIIVYPESSLVTDAQRTRVRDYLLFAIEG